MTKTYLVITPPNVSQDEFTKFLHDLPGHKFWFYSTSSYVYVNSDSTAAQISDHIIKKYGLVHHAVICTTGTGWQGAMPKEHIQYLIR